MKHTFFDTVIFRGIVIIAVASAAIIGLFIAGSPAKERARRLDDQRVQSLQQISYSVDAFYHQTGKLPANLPELQTSQIYLQPNVTLDPETQKAFEYTPSTSTTYQLCATFTTESANQTQTTTPAYPSGPVAGIWTHGIGPKCFELHITPTPVKF